MLNVSQKELEKILGISNNKINDKLSDIPYELIADKLMEYYKLKCTIAIIAIITALSISVGLIITTLIILF